MFHRESGVFKTSYRADMALYPLPIAKWTVIVLAVLFFVVAPFALDDYFLTNLNQIMVASVGAIGLNILVGYTGQISIGHAAFMAGDEARAWPAGVAHKLAGLVDCPVLVHVDERRSKAEAT